MQKCVSHRSRATNPVSMIIQFTEVLSDCSRLAVHALFTGFIYVMSLSNPPKMKNPFEAFQTVFLELDVLKVSLKVQSLHIKHLTWVYPPNVSKKLWCKVKYECFWSWSPFSFMCFHLLVLRNLFRTFYFVCKIRKVSLFFLYSAVKQTELSIWKPNKDLLVVIKMV